MPRCFFVLDLINHDLEMNSQYKQKPHTYSEYTVWHICFLFNGVCKSAWKTGFFISGSVYKCIFNMILKWRIVGNIFYLVLSFQMHETFVCYFNNACERENRSECTGPMRIAWDLVGLPYVIKLGQWIDISKDNNF